VLGKPVSCLIKLPLSKPLKAPQQEKINALAARLAPEEVQLYYQIALIGRRDLPLALIPHKALK